MRPAATRRRPSPPPPDQLPDDIPDRLRPVAATALLTLERVATAKGTKSVTLAALGRCIADSPNHDHVRIAGEFEHYWVHGLGATKPMRDIVQAYRNRLSDLPAGTSARLAAVPPAAPIDAADYVARSNAAQAALRARIAPPTDDTPAA